MAIIKNTPIGIMLPIRDGKVGYFEQSYDSFTAYRMNIINLLRTVPGERRLNPTFGCRLWNVVFEPNDGMVATQIQQIIKEDISSWVPGVSVNSVQVNNYQGEGSNDLIDMYTLYIVVMFTVISINQSDVVSIVLNKNKI